MAIDITSLEIQDEFGNSVTDFALCNVGDKLTFTYNVTISEYALATTGSPLIFNYTNGVIGNYWVYSASGQFESIRVGDIIERKDYSTGTMLNPVISVVNKISNQLIQIDIDVTSTQTSGSLLLGNIYKIVNYVAGDDFSNIDTVISGTSNTTGCMFLCTGATPTTWTNGSSLTNMTVTSTPDASSVDSILNVKTPITAMNYYWNFIENTSANDYFSKVNGSLQKLVNNSISTAVTTPAAMVFNGAKPYQIGSATIAGDGIDTSFIYGQKFIIVHETYLTPFILANQVTDLESGINASYFLNGQALKNIFKLEALYNFNDPNRILTYENGTDINLNLQGNTGGYNENFNTGVTNYYIDSIDYTNNAVPTTTLQLTTDETAFSIVLKNTIDTPFSNNNTEFTIGFIKVPFDATEYQGNTRTLAENFCFDRLHTTLGAASVDGDTFGTNYQVFKDVVGTFSTTGEIVISGKVQFATNVVSIIQESDEYKYLIFVSIQDHTKTSLASNCDRVTLLADINTFYVDASDPTMIVQTTSWIEHPYTDIETENVPKISPKLQDEIAAIHYFAIDTVGRETDSIVITSIEAKVVAYDETADEQFTLDSYSLAMANMPVINGAQYVNLDVPRVFHIEESLRKNIQIKRRSDLDFAGKLFYQVVFPFVIRYEYWLALQGVSGDFFDTAEDFNGFNNNWFRYANGTTPDWSTYVEFTINATKNGEPMSYVQKELFTIANYNKLGGDDIKTYTSDFATQLYNAVSDRWYIQSTDDTGLEATFGMVSGFQLSGCFVEFKIQTKEGNGINEFRRYSSVNVQSSDTYMKSLTGNDLVTLTNPSAGVLRARCFIDKNLIPLSTPIYSISASLWYVDPPLTEFKITEDGISKITELGDIEVIE